MWLLIIIGGTIGCSSAKMRLMALDAVDRMHSRMASRQYNEVLTTMDPALVRRRSMNAATLGHMRDSLGEVKKFWPKFSSIDCRFLGCSVIIKGETQLKEGWAHEEFKWRLVGSQTILEDYEIRLGQK